MLGRAGSRFARQVGAGRGVVVCASSAASWPSCGFRWLSSGGNGGSRESAADILKRGDREGAVARLEELRDEYAELPLRWNHTQTPGGRFEEWLQGYSANPRPDLMLPALLDLRDSWPDYLQWQGMEVALALGAVMERSPPEEILQSYGLLHLVSADVFRQGMQEGTEETERAEKAAGLAIDAVAMGLRLASRTEGRYAQFLTDSAGRARQRRSQMADVAGEKATDEEMAYWNLLDPSKELLPNVPPSEWPCPGVDFPAEEWYSSLLTGPIGLLGLGRTLFRRVAVAREMDEMARLAAAGTPPAHLPADALSQLPEARRAAMLMVGSTFGPNLVRGLWMRYGVLRDEADLRRLVTLAAAWPRHASSTAYLPDGTQWEPRSGTDISAEQMEKDDPLGIRFIASGMPPDLLSPVQTPAERVRRPLHLAGYVASRAAAWSVIAGARFHLPDLPDQLIRMVEDAKALAQAHHAAGGAAADPSSPFTLPPDSVPAAGDPTAPPEAAPDADDADRVREVNPHETVQILESVLLPAMAEIVHDMQQQKQ